VSICEYKECKKKFNKKHGLQKYCNDTCKSRASQLKLGKNAKELVCVGCKNTFKRKSAKDIRCIDCRTPNAIEKSKAKQFPVMDREIEKDLIQKWLNNPKNKIKAA